MAVSPVIRWTFRVRAAFCLAPLLAIQIGAQVPANSDSSSIQGTVTAANTPVAGANVFILETLEGALTSPDGRFLVKTTLRGPAHLVVRALGFNPHRITVTLPLTENLDVILKASATILPAQIVQASRYTAGSGSDATLTSIEVVTTPGAAADVFRAIQTFPGLQSVDEGAGLFVRGGDISETKVFLDDALVLSPYRHESPTGGAFGTFDPFLLNGIFFSSGGFGATQGDALSGVVELKTLDRPTRNNVDATVSIAGVTGKVGIRLPGQFGLRASANRTATKLLFELNGRGNEFSRVPESSDLSASFTWDYRSTGSLKVFAIRQSDQMGVFVTAPSFGGVVDADKRNTFVAVSGHELFGPVSMTFTASATDGSGRHDLGELKVHTTERYRQARALFTWDPLPRWTLRFGGDLEGRRSDLRGTVPLSDYDLNPGAPVTVFNFLVPGTRHALFVENTWRALPPLDLVFGVRSDRSTLTRQRTVDPRVSASLRIAEGISLTAAWGIYHQVPAPRQFEPSTGDPNLKAMKAQHWVLGGYAERGTMLSRIELYTKRYTNLTQFDRNFAVHTGGEGTSKGLDFFLKGRSFYRLDGRVAYSFLKADRTDAFTGILSRSPFDITHSLTATLDRVWLNRWRLATAYRYGTGRPFTDVRSAVFDPNRSLWVPQYGEPFSARVPPFTRVDATGSFLHSFWPGEMTVFFLSANNLLDRRNVSGYQFSDDYSQRSAVRSLYNRSLFFGFNAAITF